MNIVKEIMGFLLIITSFWLLNVLYYEIGWNNILKILIFLIILFVFLMIYGRLQKSGSNKKIKIITILFAVIIIGLGIKFLVIQNQKIENKEAINSYNNWEYFDEKKLNQYISEKKNILVIISAQWCITCKTNERLVLKTKEINDFFKKNDVKVLYGDFTNYDPIIDRFIKKFNRSGVPLYVVYKKDNSEPKALPEIITRDIIINSFK